MASDIKVIYQELPTPDAVIVRRCVWSVIADPRMSPEDVANVVGLARAKAEHHRVQLLGFLPLPRPVA